MAEVAELRGENQRFREAIARIGTLTNTCTYHDLNRTVCALCWCGRKETALDKLEATRPTGKALAGVFRDKEKK